MTLGKGHFTRLKGASAGAEEKDSCDFPKDLIMMINLQITRNVLLSVSTLELQVIQRKKRNFLLWFKSELFP